MDIAEDIDKQFAYRLKPLSPKVSYGIRGKQWVPESLE